MTVRAPTRGRRRACSRWQTRASASRADEVGRLFERFFRASTAATIRGTGLGLSIVKSIAEAHGGTISVRSTEGVGTTFTVELPVSSEPDGRRRAAEGGDA